MASSILDGQSLMVVKVVLSCIYALLLDVTCSAYEVSR